MEYLSAKEVEENLFRLIRKVARGETIVITDNDSGEPIAKIIPVEEISESLTD